MAVIVGFGSIVALFDFVGHRLSLSYAERLGVMLADSRPERSRTGRDVLVTRWFSSELRVVSTLVRGQFRNDMNFRLAVLSMLPITLLYIFMSLDDGGLPDPFLHLGYEARGLGLIHFAVLGMPLILMENLFRSESYRAAWIFFSTPVDRARLIGNVGNSVAIFFLLPYLAVLAGVFVWSFGSFWHAVIHTAVLGLLAHLALQMLLLAAPRLPFSEPVRKGARIGSFMGAVLLKGEGMPFSPSLCCRSSCGCTRGRRGPRLRSSCWWARPCWRRGSLCGRSVGAWSGWSLPGDA